MLVQLIDSYSARLCCWNTKLIGHSALKGKSLIGCNVAEAFPPGIYVDLIGC